MLDENLCWVKDAKWISETWYRSNIELWYCPVCHAQGDHETVDFVSPHYIDMSRLSYQEREEIRVQYCCGECFEEGIYVKFIEE